ncbi:MULTISPECIES: helix-turn-helix transcriptional regulator [unclassified Streptomyces]|uniref:helix-turn-helix transcriptional regulator n=1 Tax=unclassified Streptomyces TaxID=2593676 RepID=UPI001BE64D45|nr:MULTISPECIES: helix-turn-helix transcriptional regulator [unclassified Streptomyces]MBT2405073.1 helix-turn-helix transcriptional regulator [Streptomyces sp. ISL-21]MBT2454673.1 helix-turn-helix transcriptional regulator [Streptomyces sp. ISL-86]MBT2610799.1 helix-turn-helix transcriptional regulator [Streptomyces sp. ISL-87]
MYEERRSRLVPGAVLWRAAGPGVVVLPDGCMDLLWVEGRLLVAGPDTGPHPAGEVPGGSFAGIRLAPGTAPALLGVPAHELRDRRVDLADLWPGPEVRRLAERVGAYGDPRAGLEELARGRAAGTGPPDPFSAEVAARLGAGQTVAAVAAAVGLGERQLHRRSLDAFGYGPRTLGRVLRLQRALALARRGLPQAEVAYAAGYADQAHLAREVRALAGTTPRAYAAANRETPPPSGSSTTA